MRDWILILIPVSVIFYFVFYQDEFWKFVAWFEGLMR
jgi:hypothetical protein